jgi:hypothetical protein
MQSSDNNGGTPMNEPLVDNPESNSDLSLKDERMWATLSHLGIVASFILPSLGHILAPLIIWLVFKDRSDYVEYHAKEALNFQITITIGLIISGILVFILVGFIGLIVLAIADLVFSIIAATKANEGVYYEYPYTYRFIK